MKKLYYIFIIIVLLAGTSISAQIPNNWTDSRQIDENNKPLYYNNLIYIKFKHDLHLNLKKKEKVQYQYSEFGINSVDKILNNYNVQNIENSFRLSNNLPQKVKNRIQTNQKLTDLSKIFTVKISSPHNVLSAISELNHNPNIEYAELVPINYPLAVPNDSLYPELQHLPQIHAEEAWDIFKGEDSDSTIVIGICDTGTNWNHSDLTDNLWQNLGEDADGDGKVIVYDDSLKKYVFDPGDENNIDDDGNGYVDDFIGWDFLDNYAEDSQGNDPMDYHNHGSHVAGIAAGVTNNANGIASISWNVKYLPTSHSSPKFQNILRGYEGIVYLAEMGCDIINCSWGGGGYSKTDQEAIDYAKQLGSIIVMAAGNNNNSLPFYPSSYSNVVSVASVASNDNKAYYSNYNQAVDISAPGGDVRVDGGILSCVKNGGYSRFQGTSMASPFTAGLFGLVKAYHPNWTNEQIITQIVETTDDIDTLNTKYIGYLGTGRINALRALTEEVGPVKKTLKLSFVNVKPDDSLANNKAIEPGEIIRLTIAVRNYSLLTGSNATTFKITSKDPDIEIINDSLISPLAKDAITILPAEFKVKIADNVQSKFVQITLHASSSDAEILSGETMNFEIPINAGGILVWEGRDHGLGFSGGFIHDFLNNQGVKTLYTTNFPSNLVGYDVVFLSFGTLASGASSETFDDWKADEVMDFIKSGGKLYIEATDGLGWDQRHNNELLTMLGIDSTADGDTDHNLDSLIGQNTALTKDMSFNNFTISSFNSVDLLFPNSNGIPAFLDSSYGVVAIQNSSGEFGQKTFVSAYPLSILIDKAKPNNRYELVKRIFGFLGVEFDYIVPRFTYNPKTGHAPLEVSFNETAFASKDVTQWAWNFDNNNSVEANTQSKKFTYEIPGDFQPELTLIDGELVHRTSNPIYIFDGQSAAYYNNSGRSLLVDTNFNITSPITFEAWIYPNSLGQGNYGRIVDKNQFSLFLESNNKLRFIVEHQDGSQTDIATSPNSITFNTWQHVAATFDGDTTFHLYINGVDQELSYRKGPGSGEIDDNHNDPLVIGNRYSWSRAFNGKIDEFRLWNSAKSTNSIKSTMLHKLTGHEKDLILYYQFEEGNGDTVEDKSDFDRTLTLAADWRQGWHEGRIQTQPKSKSYCEDETALLEVKTINPGYDYIYEWYKDNEKLNDDERIFGSNTKIISIDGFNPSDTGEYFVIIRDPEMGDNEYSNKVRLSIDYKPQITIQPTKESHLDEGQRLELSIEAVGDGIEYQWYKNDEMIGGAYNPEFIIENTVVDDRGYYYCQVYNDCGDIYSDTAAVYILSGVDDIDLNKRTKLKIIPNPINDFTKISFELNQNSNIKLELFSAIGNKIAILKNEFYTKGNYQFSLSYQDLMLTSGVYYIVLKTQYSVQTNILVVDK